MRKYLNLNQPTAIVEHFLADNLGNDDDYNNIHPSNKELTFQEYFEAGFLEYFTALKAAKLNNNGDGAKI